MSSVLRAILVMVYREVMRFARARARIVTALINPIAWIVLFGFGWSSIFSSPIARELLSGVDYLTYLAPGIVSVTIFTASFIGGVTVLWDKQFGFLKEVLVAPAPRAGIALGKIFGNALTALIQGFILLLLSLVVAPSLSPWGIPLALVYALALAMGVTSLGMALALRITNMESFQAVVSLLLLPSMFVSNALYPLNYVPTWIRLLAYANPLTYAIDGMRHYLCGTSALSPLIDLAVLTAITAVLTALAVYLFREASIE